MKLQFIKNEKLPVLSWLLEINKVDKTYIIEHGENVEVGDNYFIEGAWDGDFSSLDFDETFFFCGTGGKVSNNNLIISTPNHTQERICYYEKQKKIYISNSLPFLMKRSNSELLKDYFNYDSDFQKILDGIDKYEGGLKIKGGDIKLYYYCNLSIDESFNLKINKKNNDLNFSNFSDYKNKLICTLDRLNKNVKDEKRKLHYGLITTISKGYDAPACAAIVKNIGCNEAITFNKPKKYENDSGKEIAELLGYSNIIEDSAIKYMNNNHLLEVEYISSGELGTGIVFSAFDKNFKNKVVFMGERGDKIWNKNWKDVNNNFRFNNELYTGTSHIESKLRVGYIYCPIPLFGAFNWIAIDKINNSEEMSKYSIGGDYDRPIPRRILEDLGIPRESFGTKKMGAGFNYRFDNKSRLKSRMSPNTFNSFEKEYSFSKSIKKTISMFKFYFYNKEQYINFFLNKLGIKFTFNYTNKKTTHPGVPNDLFLWSMEKMKDKYI